MRLVIRIAKQASGAFRAWCPALPGCAVFADSREEAQVRIRVAVQGYLASLDVALPRELDRMLEAEATCAIV